MEVANAVENATEIVVETEIEKAVLKAEKIPTRLKDSPYHYLDVVFC